MSVRSFTVFQDTPSQSHDSDVSPIALSATDAAATLLSTLAAIEKENLHPVTGQRARPAAGSEAKKRKTGALTTKVLVVPSAKKHKDLKGEPKKTRKPLSSSSKSRSSDAKKSSKSSRSSRKVSPLPSVAEEQVSQRQPPPLSTAQVDIDSRCYELTVSPLADISEAYDAARTESQESRVHTDREQSTEPAIHDYFSSTTEKPLEAMDHVLSDTDDLTRHSSDISTPEHKRVYSVFTFSSPSPTSERFKQAQSSPTRRNSPDSQSE